MDRSEITPDPSTDHPPPLSYTHSSCIIRISLNNMRSPNVGIMVDQRRRRWPTIIPALEQRLVFAGSPPPPPPPGINPLISCNIRPRVVFPW